MDYQFFLKRHCERFLSGKISTDKFCSTLKEMSNKFNEPGLDDVSTFEMLNFIALDKIVDTYISDQDEGRFRQDLEAHLKEEMFWK